MMIWENWKTLKDIAEEENINELVEELIEIAIRSEGENYVLSLLGDYINTIVEG
tara:strand:- start:7021 stop:7182 length:162 start_codon:yes stop_codon:yes gene_type:complete